MLASGDELSVAFAQAHLGFPTEVLERFGLLLESQLQMAAPLGPIAIGLGAFDQEATGMGIARLGDGALTPPCPTGGLGGRESQVCHPLAWVLKAGEMAEFRNPGDGDGELDAAQDWSGFDDRIQAPRLHWGFACWLEALEAFGDRVDRANGFLEDDLLCGGGANPLGEPSEMGGSPVGSARIADIVS